MKVFEILFAAAAAIAIASCIAGIGIADAASARPFEDLHTPPDGPPAVTTARPYTYVHDMTVHGYAPGNHQNLIATLSLELDGAGGQPITIGINGTPFWTGQLQDAFTGISIDLDFLNDGVATITLTKGGGQGSVIRFVRSRLVIETLPILPFVPEVPSIPVPGSIAVMGFGLLAMAGLINRRTRRHSPH